MKSQLRFYSLCLLLIQTSSVVYGRAGDMSFHYCQWVHSDSSGKEYVSRAVENCQYGKIDDAIREIESAMNTPAANEAYTWYVKGFVYKECYKTSKENKQRVEARDIAVKAFLFSRSMNDYDNNAFNADPALKYLIGTYYSDALMEAGVCDAASLQYCDQLMLAYADLSQKAGIDNELSLRISDFNKTIGMRLFNLWLSNPSQIELYNEALNRMSNAISYNPHDCVSMYNLAVFHFKMSEAGSENILSCDVEGELDIALGEMHKAESKCSDNLDILRGILNIYKLKKDETLIAEYERRIADIQKNLNLKN